MAQYAVVPGEVGQEFDNDDLDFCASEVEAEQNARNRAANGSLHTSWRVVKIVEVAVHRQTRDAARTEIK